MDLRHQVDLATRLLQYAQTGSTALAPAVLEVPVGRYLDHELWDDEVEHLFKRLPIVAALSCELPKPGAYLAQTIVGVPVLLTRDRQGRVSAFLNVCAHRGAKVVAEGPCGGSANRFSCPYHAWTYDNAGKLIAAPDSGLFGDIDTSSHGLTRLQADERLGMVFVILAPGVSVDIDEYLGGIADHFGTHGDNVSFAGTRTVKGGNWKLVVEGHLESYHFSTLHRDSIGPWMMNNCSASERFGSHQLITFCAKSIRDLADAPQHQWRPIDDNHIQPQYHFFPGALVTQFKDAMLAQLVRPGATPSEATNRLVFAQTGPADEEAGKLDAVARLVEVEDYSVSYDILQGMKAGARPAIEFGRNEPSIQHFHRALNQYLPTT